MPVKRRKAKRRMDPEAELQVWACLFHSGHDFFGGLADLGFSTEAEAREAIPEVWARLGRAYLDRRAEWGFGGAIWALETFGEPETCR